MLLEVCEPFRRIKRILDGYISSRKAFVIVVVTMALLLYVGPNIFRWLMSKSPKLLGFSGECIETEMIKYSKAIQHFDASISRGYKDNSEGFLFYVGNGKVALSVNDNTVYVYNKRSLSMSLNYNPIVFIDIPGSNVEESNVIHFTNGIAYKIQCFSVNGVFLSVTQKFLASRIVPSLLIQNIEIINHSMKDLAIHLRKDTSTKSNFQRLQVKQPYDEMLQYNLYSGSLNMGSTAKLVHFAIVSPELPDHIIIEGKSSKTITVRTIVHYSDPVSATVYDNTEKKIIEYAQQELQRSFNTPISDLITKHMDVWKQIWHSGFGISLSKAQGALNGDKINATMYYVISNSREYMSEWDSTPIYQQSLQRYLYTPDKCYGSHPTLQASTLWSSLSTIKDVNDVVSLWFLTLSKQGCQNLMKAGASGVMQAMILSFGGFKFSNHHLEFDCDPKELHRDYYFRRIIYGNSTHVNISVVVQEDNKAIIYSALDRSDRDYYACDAGCLDAPIKLGSKPAQFPVKITQPLTAILYITSDKQHMEELKHTLHVKEVVEAPAHEHHVIALHRHGHMLGGLPVFFWVSIAFLIAVFHLFLIKLIYNEYCGNAEKERSRKRYNV